ncbi:MAG TPA: sulfur carrier protein ThiS [Cytophagaceae bacterium]|jgi:sulfur carrier protein|nr:sulfur carrier protein ThiS [Cytophagaceae bacterium]
MIVLVNNKKLELNQADKIFEVFPLINIEASKGIAVAVNNAVVPKSDWGNFTLKENDHVTIIRATQGG